MNKPRLRRTIAMTVVALLASLTGGWAVAQDVPVKTAKPAADVDVSNAKTLTAEQAKNLKPKPEGLHFDKLTELSPEVAAVLATTSCAAAVGQAASGSVGPRPEVTRSMTTYGAMRRWASGWCWMSRRRSKRGSKNRATVE